MSKVEKNWRNFYRVTGESMSAHFPANCAGVEWTRGENRRKHWNCVERAELSVRCGTRQPGLLHNKRQAKEYRISSQATKRLVNVYLFSFGVNRVNHRLNCKRTLELGSFPRFGSIERARTIANLSSHCGNRTTDVEEQRSNKQTEEINVYCESKSDEIKIAWHCYLHQFGVYVARVASISKIASCFYQAQSERSARERNGVELIAALQSGLRTTKPQPEQLRSRHSVCFTPNERFEWTIIVCMCFRTQRTLKSATTRSDEDKTLFFFVSFLNSESETDRADNIYCLSRREERNQREYAAQRWIRRISTT